MKVLEIYTEIASKKKKGTPEEEEAKLHEEGKVLGVPSDKKITADINAEEQEKQLNELDSKLEKLEVKFEFYQDINQEDEAAKNCVCGPSLG